MTAGRHFFVAPLDVGKPPIGEVLVGSIICYDREFPEAARLVSQHGAELLLTPNACDLGDDILNQFGVRALENVMGAAMVNYAGEMGGRSVAFGASGEAVLPPAPNREGVYLATFDMVELRRVRSSTRGRALRAAPTAPALCRLEKQSAFNESCGFLGRVNIAL